MKFQNEKVQTIYNQIKQEIIDELVTPPDHNEM